MATGSGNLLVVRNKVPAVGGRSLPAFRPELKGIITPNILATLHAAEGINYIFFSDTEPDAEGRIVVQNLLTVVSLETARGSLPLFPPPVGRVASFKAIRTLRPTEIM